MKKASDILRNVLYPMPQNSNDLPIYFEAVDSIFVRYQIDEDLRIPLLTPFLTDTARRLLSTLPSQDVSSYIKWQQALLREHRLTPRAYLKNYLSANRNDGESCVQFSTRLTCLFKYYLNSRHVDGSFEKLQNLILADRLKASLKDSTRFHIADKEGDTWQKPSVLAELVDLYEGERRDSYSQNSRFSAASYTHSYNDNNNNKFQNRESAPRSRPFVRTPYVPRLNAWREKVRCSWCGGQGHLRETCYKYKNQSANSVEMVKQQSPNRERRCFLCQSTQHIARFCSKNQNQRPRPVNRVFSSSTSGRGGHSGGSARGGLGRFGGGTDKEETAVKRVNRVELCTVQDVAAVSRGGFIKPTNNLVVIDCGKGPVQAMIDS